MHMLFVKRAKYVVKTKWLDEFQRKCKDIYRRLYRLLADNILFSSCQVTINYKPIFFESFKKCDVKKNKVDEHNTCIDNKMFQEQI